MPTRHYVTYVVGVCGLMLALTGGCSKKALDASAGGKAYVPGQAGAMTAGSGTASGSEGASLSEQGLGSGGAGTDEAGRALERGAAGSGMGAGLGSGPGSGGPGGAGAMGGGPGGLAKGSGGSSGGSSGSSFPPLTGSKKGGAGSGDEGGTGDIVIAKADTSDSMRRQTEQMQQEQLATALAGLNDAFFGYDSWKLTEDAKQALEQDANWLKANPNKTLTVEGYCDERGTVAYNLVLGERRAKAARNYLIELGVAPNRVSTVSYGKERPFCKDHEEACHRLNRRAHLVLRTE